MCDIWARDYTLDAKIASSYVQNGHVQRRLTRQMAIDELNRLEKKERILL